MTAQFDNENAAADAATTTVDVSLAIADNTNRILIAGCGLEDDAADWTSVVFDPGGANEATFTNKGNSQVVGSGTIARAGQFFLLETDIITGTITIRLTVDQACNQMGMSVMAFYDAKQETPEAQSGTTVTTTDVITPAITTITNNAVVVDVVISGEDQTYSPNDGQTEEFDISLGSTARLGGGRLVDVTAGAQNHGWTAAASVNRMAACGLAIAPLAGVGTNPKGVLGHPLHGALAGPI